MASPQAADSFATRNKVDVFNVDGDYTVAAITTAVSTSGEVWLDMKGYSGIWVAAIGTNLTGAGPSVLSLVGDESSTGATGNVTIVSSTDSAVTGEGGYMTLEATAEQIKQEGLDNSTAYDLRYVAVKLTMANNADEATIVVVRYGPRFSRDGLTAGSAANASIS
jgi:hypothetical protein